MFRVLMLGGKEIAHWHNGPNQRRRGFLLVNGFLVHGIVLSFDVKRNRVEYVNQDTGQLARVFLIWILSHFTIGLVKCMFKCVINLIGVVVVLVACRIKVLFA